MTRSVVRLPTLQHSPRTTTRLASSVCGLMLGAWARCESVMTHSPRTLVESFSSMTKRSPAGRIHQCEAGVRMTTTCPGSRFIRSNVSVTTRASRASRTVANSFAIQAASIAVRSIERIALVARPGLGGSYGSCRQGSPTVTVRCTS